jgi:tricorn protease
MNIFCYDIITKETRKITNFDYYDVKFPSLGAKHISFENGGYIYTLELPNEKINKVKIKVIDDEITSRTELKDISSNVQHFDISPDGKRGLFSARGEIFIVPSTIPNQKSTTTNITNSSGIHERNPKWSPDGE